MDDRPPMGDGYETPEEAALAGWPPTALARVVRVEKKAEDRADVIVDTDPRYFMRAQCRRYGGLWYEEASGNDA
jgi:hypothetical protein